MLYMRSFSSENNKILKKKNKKAVISTTRSVDLGELFYLDLYTQQIQKIFPCGVEGLAGQM